ncbi:MAG: hypothetical protein KJ002_00400 [Candidatus Dadabacteria bacterium]|nr:hypothetical protein [Candidatus Dadabacteria bacterium]
MTYVDELVQVFEGAIVEIPGLGSPALKDELRTEVIARKYDLQDEGFIEVILRDDRKDLAGSFTEAMNGILGRLSSDAEREEFLKSDEIKKEAIRIFIASLEHMINYYHTSMIGKHFSST